MKRRIRKQLPEASINVTSLMDITFVLLVSFMIVAPAVKYNVALELPKVADAKVTESKKPISIQVAYEKKANSTSYFVNGRAIPLENVSSEVKSLPSYDSTSAVALEGDRTVPWEEMSGLMTHLTANNITNISIITEKKSGG